MAIPSEIVLANERQWFREQVYRLCEKFSASEISGYRTHKRNKLVGGRDDSLHLLGLAMDVRFNAVRSKKQVMTYGASDFGLHWWDSHPTGLSLHLQARPALAKTERT